MYRLYEKVPKSDEYEFGLKLLEQSENPFKDGPCLVSMIAITMWEKDINGALNQGMEALRLKTNHNENSGVGLEDFQGRILSVAYGEPSEKAGKKGRKMSNGISRKENLDDEFTKRYLFPLIEDNGKKIDVLQAMRNIRNVNLMTYCGATASALRIEECLKNRMNELGYSEQEISQIQSQMCIIGYATDIKMRREFVDKKKVESTCISVGDVNDPDVSASQSIREKTKTSGPIYFEEGYYFHYGKGEHSLKDYILQDSSLSAVISSVLTKAVSNSIYNSKSNEFKPITKEVLSADIGKIIEGVKQGKSKDEIMEGIESIAELGTPAVKQKKGLVQSFLKEDEKKFEIPDNKLEMLNAFIHENLKNRRNSTDYNLLHTISGLMTKGLNVNDRKFSDITTPSSESQTIQIALQFFEELDQELYKKARSIVEGNSEIDFNIYKLDPSEDFSRTKSDGMPIHTKTPCVKSIDGKSSVYVPCKGTVEDIYLLVHELSHTFDMIQNDNPTRNMLGEVTPYCFEAMLGQYLVENGIVTKEEATNREKGTIVSHYDDGVETFAKLELMGIKEQKGEIKQEDIIAMQKKYGITNRQLGYILGRLAQSGPSVDNRARYMIAQLIYPHYMEQYAQNPQSAIKTLKEYFENIKANNFEGSLETLGICPNIESIQGLLATNNRRISNLENTRIFSENEIGKATIRVAITEKDKANKQIQSEEIKSKNEESIKKSQEMNI